MSYYVIAVQHNSQKLGLFQLVWNWLFYPNQRLHFITFQCKFYWTCTYVFINSVLASLSRSNVIAERLSLRQNIDIVFWHIDLSIINNICIVMSDPVLLYPKSQNIEKFTIISDWNTAPGLVVNDWEIIKLSIWPETKIVTAVIGGSTFDWTLFWRATRQVLLYFLTLNRPAIGQTVSQPVQPRENLKRHKLQDHDMRYSANMGKVCIIIIYN